MASPDPEREPVNAACHFPKALEPRSMCAFPFLHSPSRYRVRKENRPPHCYCSLLPPYWVGKPLYSLAYSFCASTATLASKRREGRTSYRFTQAWACEVSCPVLRTSYLQRPVYLSYLIACASGHNRIIEMRDAPRRTALSPVLRIYKPCMSHLLSSFFPIFDERRTNPSSPLLRAGFERA
ncbi:hypothetical protein GGI42DRAFT_118552 [Trichoderma sp. SZMC 28013]